MMREILIVSFLLAGLGVLWWLWRSLETLKSSALRMAEGDLSAKIPEMPHTPVSHIARAFNTLAERFQTTLQELFQEKSELLAILSSLVEGVVALDSEGRILFVNEAVERLFGVKKQDVQHRLLLEVLRHSQLHSLAMSVLDSGTATVQEIQLFIPQETFFEAHAVPILAAKEQRGVLLVLHDITRLRKLEQMRREFVANVSHELRTPLASIKGYAETLLAGGLDDEAHRAEFVQVIEKHADDLTRLVDDLLDLSAIESGTRPLGMETVDVGELLQESLKGVEGFAQKKNVRLILHPLSRPLKLKGDRQHLRQVFMNLLDNAVKYNKPEGRVEVSASQQKEGIHISIQDSGIGIPSGDLPRIFERFYRVDKARSRELGGTGLGLAIAKHIVEAHGGTASVESVLGQGSTFSVRLPSD